MNKQLKAFLLAPLASMPTAIHFGAEAQLADNYAETIYETFIVLFLGIPLFAYFLTLLFFPVHLLFKKLKMQSALAYVLPPVMLSAAAFIFFVYNGSSFDASIAFNITMIVFTCGLVPWVFWCIAVKSETTSTSTTDSSDAQSITKKSSKFGMVALSAATMLMFGGYWFKQLHSVSADPKNVTASTELENAVDSEDAYSDEELKALKEKLNSLTMLNDVANCLGFGEDDSKKIYLACRKHAESGALDAQKRLADLYLVGEGTEEDIEKYFYWTKKAAEQGDAEFQYRLGLAFFVGQGVTKNLAEAISWFNKAAAQGNSAAKANLGVIYYYALGVAKDETRGITLLKEAAADGDETAKEVIELLAL